MEISAHRGNFINSKINRNVVRKKKKKNTKRGKKRRKRKEYAHRKGWGRMGI